MAFSISGKTAIVTGAANGIGLATARHFADQGANVICADIDEKRLIKELSDLPEDGNLRYFAGDLREKLTIANLISTTIDAFDRIDILVNASRQICFSDALDPEDKSVEKLWEQNVMTALRVTRQVAKRMIKQSEGRDDNASAGAIINLSSIAADRTQAELLGYSVASAGLEQMTRAMALSLAPHRIRINAISFGSVMSASLQKFINDTPQWRDDIKAHTPMGRIASAKDLAGTLQFLASEASEFMTGSIISVDGGRSLLDPVTSPAH